MAWRRFRTARALAAAGVAVLVCGTATGCLGMRHSAAPKGQVVDVTERDFSIIASPKVVDAGDVDFVDHNEGPDAHELIVVRASSPHLRLRSDGLTVDEEGLARSIPGSLEPAESGAVRSLHVRLAPGRYYLICNMAGHFMAGMETAVTVR